MSKLKDKYQTDRKDMKVGLKNVVLRYAFNSDILKINIGMTSKYHVTNRLFKTLVQK